MIPRAVSGLYSNASAGFKQGFIEEKPESGNGNEKSNTKPYSMLNPTRLDFAELNSMPKSDISLSRPLAVELTEADQNLIDSLTPESLQELAKDLITGGVSTSIGLLISSIEFGNISANDRDKLCKNLKTLKDSLALLKGPRTVDISEFAQSLFFLKKNIGNLTGNHETYSHILIGDVEKLIDSITKILKKEPVGSST